MAYGRKNIAVLGLTYPFRGGISHYSTILVRELRRKHNVTFITLNRQYPEILFPGKTQYDDSANKLVEENDPIIDSINPLSWLKAAFTLQKENADLVVVQWWNPFFALAFGTTVNLLTLISKIRICFLCHNVVPHESTLFDRILSRYAFQRVKYFIVHSEEDRVNLLSLKPNAIVRKTYHPTYSIFSESLVYDKEQARKDLNLSPKKNVVLFFGLIRRYKGLKYLIHAIKDVLKYVECTLLIVGEFYELKEECLELIKELHLDDHILVIDKYVKNEDVSRYFCSADVVVLPYVEATQSGIVQIAFALGRPVITTDVGGLSEVVEHEKTGFIVQAGSSNELAAAIIKYYLENYEVRLCTEIRKRVDKFSWNNEVREIEAIMAESHG